MFAKPKPEDYGYQSSTPWDEGGWCLEGGQEAFMEALAHYEAQLEEQEHLDKTAEAIDMGGGCSRCGDLSGFECICEDDFQPCERCIQPDACDDFGCSLI